MRLALASLAILAGLTAPLLLDGRPFSNSLFGALCACAAIAICYGPATDERAGRAMQRASRAPLGLGVLLAATLVAMLPAAYREEARFQRGRERAIQEMHAIQEMRAIQGLGEAKP